jgi:hypothetical protein
VAIRLQTAIFSVISWYGRTTVLMQTEYELLCRSSISCSLISDTWITQELNTLSDVLVAVLRKEI